MTTVHEIEQALYDWAPRPLAMDWDNVGLLVGSGAAEVTGVLVALDVTEGVVSEAAARGAELIVAHHPLMNNRWHPVQRVVAEDPQGRLITALLRQGISAICMHTNLDAAEGGVNDCLARALGLPDPEPLSDEGIGRAGALPEAMALADFLPRVSRALGGTPLRYRDAGRTVRRVAVGGGSCIEYLANARALGCDTFVTGDVKYHDFLDTQDLNLIDAGHFPTENPLCAAIQAYLSRRFPSLRVLLSETHRDVIQFYF